MASLASEVGGLVRQAPRNREIVSCRAVRAYVRARGAWSSEISAKSSVVPFPFSLLPGWVFPFPFCPAGFSLFPCASTCSLFPCEHHEEMDSNEIKWIHMKSNEITWYQMKSRETKWIKVKSNEINWTQMTSSEFKWNQMNSNEIHWNQMNSNGNQINQMNSNEIKLSPPPHPPNPPIQL